MASFPPFFKVTDASGNCIQYSDGDVVYKNGKTYIAIRTPDLCKSPEHKGSGWVELSSVSGSTGGFTGGIQYFYSTTPPINPEEGDEWFEPETGKLYKYIKDADSEQWVELPGGGIGGGGGGIGVTGPTGPQGIAGVTGPTGPTEDNIVIFIDSTPDDISTGLKGYKQIAYNSIPIEWYVIAGQTGSIEFDVKASSFANYPTTNSIVGGNFPGLSGAMKNSNTGITLWGGLTAGDVVDFVINSNTGIQKVGLFIKIRRNA